MNDKPKMQLGDLLDPESDYLAERALISTPPATLAEAERFVRGWALGWGVDPEDASEELRSGKTALAKLLRLAFADGTFTSLRTGDTDGLVYEAVERHRRDNPNEADTQLRQKAKDELSQLGKNYGINSIKTMHSRERKRRSLKE